jgi:hypothetical protein
VKDVGYRKFKNFIGEFGREFGEFGSNLGEQSENFGNFGDLSVLENVGQN